MTDSSGQNPGVQPITTHSTQIAWQFQLFKNGHSNVIIAIESYSRYVLLLPFYFSPAWDEVKVAFFEQWLAHMQGWMKMGGFISNSNHQAKLDNQFQSQTEPKLRYEYRWACNGYAVLDT